MGKKCDFSDFEHGTVQKLLICWDSSTNHLSLQKTGQFENVLWAGVLCEKMTCWYQRSEENGQTASSWATAAEDHNECHSCQLRTGKWDDSSHRLTKTGQQKTGKTNLVRMWLNIMKAWIHRACVTSSGCWCDGVGVISLVDSSLLSTSRASFKPQPEWLQNKSPRYKLRSSNWFLDRDVHSNIHSHLILIK